MQKALVVLKARETEEIRKAREINVFCSNRSSHFLQVVKTTVL